MKRKSRKARALIRLAGVVDIAHRFVFTPSVFFGGVLLGPRWHSVYLVVVVGLQLLYSNCPINIWSSWLRRKAGEKSEARKGVVWVMYCLYGKWAAVPIAVFVFLTSAIIRRVFAS